jgi:hypothetical protein
VADAEGKFDWGEPDEEVHSFFNTLERPVGTYLYGRRLYEVMVVWDDAAAFSDRATSSSAVPHSRPTRSAPAWWTSAT